MSEWEAWYTFMQPPQVQPPLWEDADVFSNLLPWTEASGVDGITADHLRFKLYTIQQELLRCQEELHFLPQDALNSLAYFQHQQSLLHSAHATCEAQLSTATAAWHVQQLRGRLHILSSWQRHVESLHCAALQAFAKAGWVAPASW